MAERRMFAKTIIDSDAFLDMPMTTQCLYFHLSMRADDEGFVNNPKRIQRMIGVGDDDLKLLIAKGFIIPFESGICVVKHWFIHNYIRGDRFKATSCVEEKAKLFLDENKIYNIADVGMSHGIPIADQMETQYRLGKDSIGKDSIGKSKKKATEVAPTPTLTELENRFSNILSKAILDWCTYKQQRNENYTPIGLKSLLTQIENNAKQYGEQAVIDLIYNCMSSNWKGIIFDRLKKAEGGYISNSPEHTTGNPFADALLKAESGESF